MDKNISLLCIKCYALKNYAFKFSRKLLRFISDTVWRTTAFFAHHTFAVVLVPGKHTVLYTITNQSVVDAHVAVTEVCVGQTWSCKTEFLMRRKTHGWCNTNLVHMMDLTHVWNLAPLVRLNYWSTVFQLDKELCVLQIFLYSYNVFLDKGLKLKLNVWVLKKSICEWINE